MLRMIIRTPRRQGAPPADSGGIQDTTGVNSTDKDVPDRDSQDDSHDNSRSDDADSNPPQHDAVSTPTRRSDSTDDDSDVDLREPWVEYIQRATRTAEQLMEFHRVESWVTTHKKKVWRMAAKVANHAPTRWTWRALQWQPDAHRHHGGQHKRWDDEVLAHLRQHRPDLHPAPAPTRDKGQPNDLTWIRTAQDTITWSTLEHHYVNS